MGLGVSWEGGMRRGHWEDMVFVWICRLCPQSLVPQSRREGRSYVYVRWLLDLMMLGVVLWREVYVWEVLWASTRRSVAL